MHRIRTAWKGLLSRPHEERRVKAYISFGQAHTHRVLGKTFDCDCLAIVQGVDRDDCRARAFKIFGDQWHNCYSQEEYDAQRYAFDKYFPRGPIPAMKIN